MGTKIASNQLYFQPSVNVSELKLLSLRDSNKLIFLIIRRNDSQCFKTKVRQVNLSGHPKLEALEAAPLW